MFTGIIESVGRVSHIEKLENYLKVSIAHNFPASEIRHGESIACDGACLTIVAFDEKVMTFEVSQETLDKTIASSYQIGSQVNLERAVRAGDRLDGHFVTGHIDDRGKIENIKEIGKSLELTILYKPGYDKLIVTKGSIAVNGVSLTVNEAESGWCSINLIPYTLEHTNLSHVKAGQSVNLEFDLIGKYATKSDTSENISSLTFAKLEESGW